MDTPAGKQYTDAMLALFYYIRHCLESTKGLTWVLQALKAGFLTAFCQCSPHFAQLDHKQREMVLGIMRDVLPKYLVYKSVVLAIDDSMTAITQGPLLKRVNEVIINDFSVSIH
jgi:hypothetical protein